MRSRGVSPASLWRPDPRAVVAAAGVRPARRGEVQARNGGALGRAPVREEDRVRLRRRDLLLETRASGRSSRTRSEAHPQVSRDVRDRRSRDCRQRNPGGGGASVREESRDRADADRPRALLVLAPRKQRSAPRLDRPSRKPSIPRSPSRAARESSARVPEALPPDRQRARSGRIPDPGRLRSLVLRNGGAGSGFGRHRVDAPDRRRVDARKRGFQAPSVHGGSSPRRRVSDRRQSRDRRGRRNRLSRRGLRRLGDVPCGRCSRNPAGPGRWARRGGGASRRDTSVRSSRGESWSCTGSQLQFPEGPDTFFRLYRFSGRKEPRCRGMESTFSRRNR